MPTVAGERRLPKSSDAFPLPESAGDSSIVEWTEVMLWLSAFVGDMVWCKTGSSIDGGVGNIFARSWDVNAVVVIIGAIEVIFSSIEKGLNTDVLEDVACNIIK